MRGSNQTASAKSEKNWREKSRETYAKRHDFYDKHGCKECEKFKSCETRKKYSGVCDYDTY